MRYYVDTCIWIDYWENRYDNLRPLGEFAANFLSNLTETDIVYYSKLSIRELRKQYSIDIITSIFDIVKDKLVFLETFENDVTYANTIIFSGLAHDADAMHIALAKRVGATLVTRDKEILFAGIVKAFKPEDLI